MPVFQLKNARVTVMGLGRFGGGVGVARWLCAQGARVLVTDKDPAERLAEPLAEIDDLVRAGRITLRLAGTDAEPHRVEDFTGADLVVANPAVPAPWNNPYLRAAEGASVPVTTEIRLLVERLPRRERVIGVTGTVGKSTTSAMIDAALRSGPAPVHFGGNIGGSLLGKAHEIGEDDWVVLELSSAMLHWLRKGVGDPEARGWSPGIAVITNFAPNHLDWHADLAHYASSKMQALRDQKPGDSAVLHASLAQWPAQLRATSGRGLPESHTLRWVNYADVDEVGRLATPGKHNRMNAAFARTVAAIAGVDMLEAIDAIAAFPGLPHRLQHLGAFLTPAGPVDAFNDSKSTTPGSTALAISAMDDDPDRGAGRTRLIIGGYDKGIDLAPMVQPAARCAAAYTIGATGPALAAAIRAAGGRATECGTLDLAVERAMADARTGEAVLLSPGCASWDQFEHFEERGRAFASALERWGAKKIRTGP